METLVQHPHSDSRRICLHEGDAHVPLVLETPLTREECAPFLNSLRPVTFAVKVPLSILLREGQRSLFYYIAVCNFDFRWVDFDHVELRAVGASFGESGLGKFGEDLNSSVHLQLICTLKLTEDTRVIEPRSNFWKFD